uniref:Uncharacterized protein n=1 Tax=Rhizophora mucronata TaxID=61149 RepID=A0A2P2Q515_RHIMU
MMLGMRGYGSEISCLVKSARLPGVILNKGMCRLKLTTFRSQWSFLYGCRIACPS